MYKVLLPSNVSTLRDALTAMRDVQYNLGAYRHIALACSVL